MVHQCYYCEQFFDSKEALYEHLEVHADTKNKQTKNQKKEKSS